MPPTLNTPPRHARIGDIWLDVSVRESHTLEADVSEHPVEQGSVIADHIRPLPRQIEIEGLVTNTPIEPPQSHAGSATRVNDALQLYVSARNPRRIAPTTQAIEAEPGLGGFETVPGTGQPTALLGVLHLDVRSRRRYSMEVNNTERGAQSLAYAVQALRFDQPFDRVTEVHAALLRIVDESLLVRVSTALATYDSVALTRLSIERSAKQGRGALQFTATGRVLRIVASETVDAPALAKPKARGKQPTTPVANPGAVGAASDAPHNSFGYNTEGSGLGVVSELASTVLGRLRGQ